jgi:DNA-binding LytR/AlgR family response regulator
LFESLQKFKKLKSAFSIDFEQLMAEMKGSKPDYKKRFVIHIGSKIKTVETSEVAYFYAMGKNVFMKTLKGNSFPAEFSLDRLENLIDPSHFFRINRKYIINMEAIESMVAWSRSRVKIKLNPPADDEMDTIVSVDRSPEFKEWLNK